MSDIYKQKQYELEKELEHIELLSNIIPAFEDYVKETNDFIDKLLDETKEINMLRNIIKEVKEYIEKELDIEKICRQEKSLTICKKRLLEILDKVEENK